VFVPRDAQSSGLILETRTCPPLLLAATSCQRTLVEAVRTPPFYLFRYGMRGFVAGLRGARYETKRGNLNVHQMVKKKV
jgi:hypothetical protein